MWSQTYDPLNAPVLSALVAASPIILFLLCLTVFKLSGIKSALITLVLTLGIALGVFRLPVTAAAGSILYGFLSAFWPIGWIVLMAVWLYRITVRSGKFAVVRASVSSISPDQRIQVLLIALCFAGFIEGAAGFGIPIAISVALLVALGFNPLKAAMLSLVANATVGAYGAVGIPVTTGAAIGNVDLGHLSDQMVWVLQIFAALVPVLVVAIQDGLRGVREVGPIALATGIVISGLQSIMLWVLQAPELIGILPPLVGLVFLGMSRAWPVALAFTAIFTAIPFLVISSRARNRRTRLREVWPEAVDTLVSGVRAGMSLPEALTNLGERGPEAVRPQFRAFATDYAATARFDSSLDRLKARFADPVADRIVEALRLAHEVGGTDLGTLLRSLSQMLREDMRTRGELEARQSWTVNGAKVAVAAPWLVLALLSTRTQAAAAYATTAGAVVLLIGAVVSVVAYRLMLRLGRLPEEERTLR